MAAHVIKLRVSGKFYPISDRARTRTFLFKQQMSCHLNIRSFIQCFVFILRFTWILSRTGYEGRWLKNIPFALAWSMKILLPSILYRYSCCEESSVKKKPGWFVYKIANQLTKNMGSPCRPMLFEWQQTFSKTWAQHPNTHIEMP